MDFLGVPVDIPLDIYIILIAYNEFLNRLLYHFE